MFTARDPGRPTAMTVRASVTLLTVGVALDFAIRTTPSFLNTHVAGAILIVTGLVGLWAHGGNALLHAASASLRQVLDQIAPVHGIRVPLDDLIDQPVRAARDAPPTLVRSPQQASPDGTGPRPTHPPHASGCHVWDPHTGHDSADMLPARPPEVRNE